MDNPLDEITTEMRARTRALYGGEVEQRVYDAVAHLTCEACGLVKPDVETIAVEYSDGTPTSLQVCGACREHPPLEGEGSNA